MSIYLCSLNVRGLGNKRKREQVFHWLKEQAFDIYCLQETHLPSSLKDQIKMEWGFDVLLSGKSRNSEGVCILFNSTVKYSILNYIDIIEGRLQAVDIQYNDTNITLINVYGPNTDDSTLFDSLNNYVLHNADNTFIIGGDFNTVLDINLDKKNGNTETHKKCRKEIKSILDIHDLTDIWRLKHPDKRHFTWHSNNRPPIFSRLDYFLISNNIVNNTTKTHIKTSYRTDHSLITLSLNFDKIERGPGYFKLNNSLLLDKEYQNIIKTSISDTVTCNIEANPNTLWEVIKGNIRNETIRYATHKKRKDLDREKQLNLNIENLNIKIQAETNNDILKNLRSDLAFIKLELTEIIDKRINGIIIRSKAQLVENSEKNSKLFSNLEKKKSERKTLKQIQVDKNIITKPTDILLQQKLFYQHLYKLKPCSYSNINFFNSNINVLNDTDKQICEGLLTENECFLALKEMKNNKSPGSDGLTTEFYKIFWTEIKTYLTNSLNYSFEHGHLTTLQKQSVITILPKPDKDILFLENWRPISLLNVDYKISSKSIANRIKKVISSIISSAQTGFIKGRYIGENVRLLNDILEYVEDTHLPALLFFTDFEKAFDSVSHEFMFKTLDHFNFGPDLKHWIKLFYKDANSCVINNGHCSSFFPIQRGVRQGCPLSPYLFIICIELLSYEVSINKNIKGINHCNEEVKNTLFADDATFLTDGSKKSFETLISVLDNYSYISGLTLNIKKCNALRAGSLKSSNIVFSKNKSFQWKSDSAKALGMTFFTEKKYTLEKNIQPKLQEFKICLK